MNNQSGFCMPFRMLIDIGLIKEDRPDLLRNCTTNFSLPLNKPISSFTTSFQGRTWPFTNAAIR